MRGYKGFAQLIVLWGLLLLGMLAASFAFAMRTEATAARNGLDSARAYYQARTGINKVIALLGSSAPDNVLKQKVTGGGEDASYEARIVSEEGKIDINFVQEDMLKEMLKKGGLSPDVAEIVGDSILDWKDVDGDPRPGGAEDGFYASLPEPIRPRNGMLVAVDELRFVRGVTPEIFDRLLSRVFTVHGRSVAVNVNEATVEVLKLLPGFTPEAAEGVYARRLVTPFKTPAEVVAFLPGTGTPAAGVPILSTFSTTRTYTITSVGKVGTRISRTVSCRVEIGAGGKKSVKIMRWDDNAAAGEGG
jgi:type II secretory pathway component PulK